LKQLRIIIIAFILTAAGGFVILTAGSDPEAILLERLVVSDQRLALLALLLCAFILLSTLSGLPVFYLSMAMGFLLSFVPAMLICWAISTVAVMATFYLVRFAFTSCFRERYGKKKLIRRINKRIRRYGLWSVVFSRAIYIIPTNLINFSFPLSQITTRSYLTGTVLGLLPECLVNVGTGTLIRHEVILLSAPETRTWQALVIGGFILAFTLVFLLLRIRQNRVRRFRRLKAVPYKD
jgi:uncharacterized membrane protein YdjX (TVP38/TMEM64 family)